MPRTPVGRLAQRLAETKRRKLPIPANSPPSIFLAEHVVIAFHVSNVAALVRLKQLGVGRVKTCWERMGASRTRESPRVSMGPRSSEHGIGRLPNRNCQPEAAPNEPAR
jgi:hypothetical protein